MSPRACNANLLSIKSVKIFSQSSGESTEIPNTHYGFKSFFAEYGEDGYLKLQQLLANLHSQIDESYNSK